VYTRGDHDETHTVTKVESKKGETLVTVEWDRDLPTKSFQVISVRPDGLHLVSETGNPYDPPMHILRCPIELGKEWESKTKREPRLVISDKRKVAASEKVKVPAGEFEAVRVEAGFSTNPGGQVRSVVYWYAPNVGIVKMDGPPELVLKAFSLGKELSACGVAVGQLIRIPGTDLGDFGIVRACDVGLG
jgi:hypothetical protein